MKRTGIVMLLAGACALCLGCALLAGCGSNATAFQGTWILDHSEVINRSGDEPTPVYTAEDMDMMHESGWDIFMEIDADGSLMYYSLGNADKGTWKANGSDAEAILEDDTVIQMRIEGDTLVTDASGLTSYFKKGDPSVDDEEVDAAYTEPVEDDNPVDANGMSTMFEESAPTSQETVIADDDICKIVIDGTGVTKDGDPGYDVRVVNRTDDVISAWVEEPFTIDGASAETYLIITLDGHKGGSTALSFEHEDIGSSSVDALKNVKGAISIASEDGKPLATYDVDM